MKITMIGSGYVGLVTGACFAEWGHEVVCVDKDARKIAALKQGRIPIYEPGLETLVARNVASGRLSFTLDLAQAVPGADAVFIAVGTPPRRGDGDADMSYVYAAAREIAACASRRTVIVTKSTVPVGTGDTIERMVALANPGVDITVASNPEFLREGTAISDFQAPDRVVIGADDARARDILLEVYRPLSGTSARIVATQRRTAELIKYAANAFLATKITFINEMADLCEQVGAAVQDVALGVGLDHRIGREFLNAGPGYGGSCFPKDTLALLRTAQDHGVGLRLVEQTVAVNDARKRRMALKVIEAAGGSVAGLRVAVLGLTFKPNTDDMREAPSINLIEALQRAGAIIHAHDPAGIEQAKLVLEDVAFFTNPYACVEGADAVVLMTEWESLKGLDLHLLHSLMRKPVMVDLRNVFSPDELEARGFTSVGLGTPSRNDRRGAVSAEAFAAGALRTPAEPDPSGLPHAMRRLQGSNGCQASLDATHRDRFPV